MEPISRTTIKFPDQKALPKCFSLFCTIALIIPMFFSSCKEEVVYPATGDLRININRDDLGGATYWIYTEIYLTANTYVPPVQTGTIQGNVVRAKGLNAGNYILVLELDAGNNWRIFLQVTAGQERTFDVK